MSVVGPFIVAGVGAFFVACAPGTGGNFSLGEAFSLALIAGGALGLIGHGVDRLREPATLRFWHAVGYAFGLVLLFSVIAQAKFRCQCDLQTSAPLHLAGIAMLIVFARRIDQSAPGSFVRSIAAGWLWAAATAWLLLAAWLLPTDAAALARNTALATALLVSLVLLIETLRWLARLERLTLTARPEPRSGVGDARRVIELGAGDTWARVGPQRSAYRAPNGVWVHGDPALVRTSLCRLSGVVVALGVMALAGLGLLRPRPLPPRTQPSSSDAGFYPAQSLAPDNLERCPSFRRLLPRRVRQVEPTH